MSIKKNENLKEVFPAPPMPALRQPKNLRRILCCSRLKPVKRIGRLQRKAHKNAPVWRKCGKPCHICPYTLPACYEARSHNSECTNKNHPTFNLWLRKLHILLEMYFWTWFVHCMICTILKWALLSPRNSIQYDQSQPAFWRTQFYYFGQQVNIILLAKFIRYVYF